LGHKPYDIEYWQLNMESTEKNEPTKYKICDDYEQLKSKKFNESVNANP